MDELERIREKKLKELVERAGEKPQKEAFAEPFELSDATFDREVKNHSLLLVDFWAPWCGPCKMVAPVIRQLAKDYSGKVAFGKLNTDENPQTAMRFRIMSIPTLMLFKNGKTADIIVGAAPRAGIEAMLRKHIT
ncbi:MAG: thioredoxin [Thermoplasmata archaeon]